jgi:hypothetical protein
MYAMKRGAKIPLVIRRIRHIAVTVGRDKK